jgi:hypothetical protein
MIKVAASAVFATLATLLLASAAQAASYPVQGRWGQSTSTDKNPIDCSRLRTVDFQGERRFDSGGGVPDFRAISVQPEGQSSFRVVEEFRTGQVNGRNSLTIRVKTDPDRVELDPARGASLQLRRCK